ncbi:hypothetical protein [Taklimakanibacter lacteus]|uniref:hypothetical protein n=1 Tax=Taklimakanibacter lacteus TaxID=2268456 RepID=UPI0034D74639
MSKIAKRHVGRRGQSPRPAKTIVGLYLELRAARVEPVIKAAERSGLLNEKDSRIGGRVSRKLIDQAKRRTGIETDTDLIEFALANIALEDRFAEVFKESRGKVDSDIKLGF